MDPQRFKNNRKEENQLAEKSEHKSEQVLRQTLRAKKRRARRRFFAKLKMLAIVLLLIAIFFLSPLFKIREAQVLGAVNAGIAPIEEAAARQKGRHFLLYGKNEILSAAKNDAFVKSVQVKTGMGGDLTVTLEEYSADYALLAEGRALILNREGRVLGSRAIIPAGAILLLDNTAPLTPGNTMYGEGPKKTFLMNFKQIMDQNTSAITFSQVDITDPLNVILESGPWQVEIGATVEAAALRAKLNQAINILKQAGGGEGGIIDLRFNAPPVLRPKGGS